MKLVFFRSTSAEILAQKLNTLPGVEFTLAGPPQWDGKAWVAWGKLSKEGVKLAAKGKLKLGDID